MILTDDVRGAKVKAALELRQVSGCAHARRMTTELLQSTLTPSKLGLRSCVDWTQRVVRYLEDCLFKDWFYKDL